MNSTTCENKLIRPCPIETTGNLISCWQLDMFERQLLQPECKTLSPATGRKEDATVTAIVEPPTQYMYEM